MPDRTRRLSPSRAAAATLIVAQTAWIAAGFVFPALPGWTMFSRVERMPTELVDREGKVERVYDFVPRDLYVIDAFGARAIAAFVCRRERARAPWLLRWSDGRTEDACPR